MHNLKTTQGCKVPVRLFQFYDIFKSEEGILMSFQHNHMKKLEPSALL